MKRLKFSEICRESKVKEIRRVDERGGIILIGDSVSARHWIDDPGGVKYKTVWAYGKDEDHLEIGQPIYFKPFFEDKGVWQMTTLEQRIALAEATAREWLNARSRAH